MQKRVCPVCNRSYSEGEDFCPQDGATLTVPVLNMGGAADGRIIGERFRLDERIGEGRTGVVYRATHCVLESPYAVKLLRREFLSDERAMQRFFREARVASVLSYPHIVSVYDFGKSEEGEPYLVMEYVEGVTLRAIKEQSPARVVPLTQAVDVALQIARALRHAHGLSVLHRDIQPDNIMLTQREGQTDWVKILDFGTAKLLDQPAVTQEGERALGTLEFMAPEMLSAADRVGPPVDLYALGVLLHDVIAGAPPFSGSNAEIFRGHLQATAVPLSERRRDAAVPAELDALVAALLDKDPARRPTAEQTVQRLEELRPRLPPRSVRGMLVAQTCVLGAPDPGAARAPAGSGAATVLLPPGARTVALQPLLRELDRAEDEVVQSSQRLFESCLALAQPLWPEHSRSRRPAVVTRLFQQVAECQRAEEGLELERALLQEQLEQERERRQRRRAELHGQILSLSSSLQFIRGLSAKDKAVMRSSLLELEREHTALSQDGEATGQLVQLQARLQELRSELHRARRKLAAAVLQAARAAGPAPGAGREIEKALEQLDGAEAALGLLLSRLSPSPRT